MDPRWTAVVLDNLRPLLGAHVHAPDIGAVLKGFPLMKVFATPRLDAAHLTSFFRARAVARLARAADRAAAVGVEREDPQPCDRLHHPDDAESTQTSFWILHAR